MVGRAEKWDMGDETETQSSWHLTPIFAFAQSVYCATQHAVDLQQYYDRLLQSASINDNLFDLMLSLPFELGYWVGTRQDFMG